MVSLADQQLREKLELLFSYLPPALQQEEFRLALKDFPDLEKYNPYTCEEVSGVLQGDILLGVKAFSDDASRPVMVLSNSCDINPENLRKHPKLAVVANMVNLDSYTRRLQSGHISSYVIEDITKALRAQLITNMLFMPKHLNCRLDSDYAVLFDSLVSLDPASLYKQNVTCLAHLSLIGKYMFLFKLSYHFCRLSEDFMRIGNTN